SGCRSHIPIVLEETPRALAISMLRFPRTTREASRCLFRWICAPVLPGGRPRRVRLGASSSGTTFFISTAAMPISFPCAVEVFPPHAWVDHPPVACHFRGQARQRDIYFVG